MSASDHSTRHWLTASATLILGTTVSAGIATLLLDSIIHRPVPASVTTLIPGYVYASATIMKVCLAVGILSAAIALLKQALRSGAAGGPQEDLPGPGFPKWGISAVALTASTPLIGAVVVITAQAMAAGPQLLSQSDLSKLSRTAVLFQLATLSVGILSAVASRVRRERPVLLPMLGLIANAALIVLFWRLEFYAPGFDQDTWAPR